MKLANILGQGGSKSIQGSGTFNSSTGTTITHNLGNTNYRVSVIATSDPGGALGEIFITKSTNNVIIKCSGDDTVTTFDYIIHKD
jgi:hypothetical protein